MKPSLCLFRAAAACAPILLATGCATGRASYDGMRAEYGRAATETREALADDSALAGGVLDRQKLVAAVVARNPSVTAARESWRAALARYPQAGRYEDPRVSFDVAPLSIGAGANVPFGYGLSISQAFPFPGKVGVEKAAAVAEAEAAEMDWEGARQSLALMASLLFDDYYVAARSLEVNDHHRALLEQLRATASTAYETGHASAQDTLAAEVELVRLERERLAITSARDVTIAQINELLHRDPAAPLAPPPATLALPEPLDARSAADLSSEALTRRPDVAAAQARVRAASARADVARKEYWPELEVMTAYDSRMVMAEHRWVVGVGLALPLQIGRRNAATEEADADRRRREADVASLEDGARGAVAVALRRVREARDAVKLYETRLVPAARAQVDAARAGFIASQNGFAEVMQAEKNLRGAELEVEMARADVDRRVAALERAVGRAPGLDHHDAGRAAGEGGAP
jgi:cobalt-zinc-cadmium efflux system outer membrane protein